MSASNSAPSPDRALRPHTFTDGGYCSECGADAEYVQSALTFEALHCQATQLSFLDAAVERAERRALDQLSAAVYGPETSTPGSPHACLHCGPACSCFEAPGEAPRCPPDAL